MTDLSTYERPNTVSGLLAKHKELSILRDQHAEQVKRITRDMAHLEAAVKVFDPAAKVYEMKEAVTRPRAKRGAIKYHLLTMLREAKEPLTSRQIALAWIAEHKLGNDDATYKTIRQSMAYSIKDCVKQGLIEQCGQTTDHDRYGPYKLWRLRVSETDDCQNSQKLIQ